MTIIMIIEGEAEDFLEICLIFKTTSRIRKTGNIRRLFHEK
jgi:hypothetical protein